MSSEERQVAIDKDLAASWLSETSAQQPDSLSDVAETLQMGASLGESLDFVAVLAHLGLFGILGVIIRYGIEVLFGPSVAHVTDDFQPLFIDLPANMFGCFVMGWVGVVFKKDIASYLDPLAVGLSTGLCGSITTFASWNQRMLAISASGFWVRALAGYIVGGQLSIMSLIIGIDSANGFMALLSWYQSRRQALGQPPLSPGPDNVSRRMSSLAWILTLGILSWVLGMCGSVLDKCAQRKQVWLSISLAPFGVWARWYLARLNGSGFGDSKALSWIPMGTLAANVIGCTLEAVVSIVNLKVDTDFATLLSKGLQLGFVGCMSTVSTFVVELRNLRNSARFEWRAYVYYVTSFALSFVIGLAVYIIPVMQFKLHSSYNTISSCFFD